jgi:hypothetical protein
MQPPTVADRVAATPEDQLLSLGFHELASRAMIHRFLISSLSSGHVPFGLSTLDSDARLGWLINAHYWSQQARRAKLDPLPKRRDITSWAESLSNWSEFEEWAKGAEAKCRGILPVHARTKAAGRKADPKLKEIADFLASMKAQRMQWKEMTAPIAERFGKRYKASSLPKLLVRKGGKKTGTE